MAHAEGMPDCGACFPAQVALRPSGAELVVERVDSSYERTNEIYSSQED